MRKNVLTFLLTGLLSFIISSCGPEPRPASTMEDCLGEFGPNAGLCQGTCRDLANDRQNCGRCDNPCGDGANACVEGQCVCSNGTHSSKVPCPSGTECHAGTGFCLTADPNGASCDDIDGNACEEPGRVCVNGYCTRPDCNHPEECNLKDDNCDGLIDLDENWQPITKTCYHGPPGTAGVGICTEGVETCVLGTGTYSPCAGEQFPVSELGILNCDGLDNDCNTCVDDHLDANGLPACGPQDPKRVDIVFIIDRSGSMYGTISAVVSAVQSWAANIGMNPNIRFALVDPTDQNDPDGVSVTLGLTDYITFNGVISGISANGSGREPMHYAAQMVLNGAFNTELNFAQGATRIVISIGDESTADTMGINTVPGVDESTMCGAVPNDTVLAVITNPAHFDEWDLCTSNTSVPPTAMPLSNDPAVMLANLNLVISSVCY